MEVLKDYEQSEDQFYKAQADVEQLEKELEQEREAYAELEKLGGLGGGVLRVMIQQVFCCLCTKCYDFRTNKFLSTTIHNKLTYLVNYDRIKYILNLWV